MAAAVLGSAALAPTAHAAVAGATKAITVTSNTSDVLLADFADGATVSALRDGITIATGVSHNVPGTAPPEGGINSAHLLGGGGCWTGFTPQLLPGDTIRVGTDSTVVKGVTADQLVVAGAQMLVHGTAVGATGAPLAAAEIDAQLDAPGGRFSQGSAGGQFLSAQRGDLGGIITYDAPGSSHWTARWPVPASAADRAFAEASTVIGAWTGPGVHPPTAGGEMTHYAAGATPGPTDACAASPYAPDAATGADRPAVNAVNQDTPLVIKGLSHPGVTAVTTTLTDAAGKSVARPAALDGRVWTATFPGSVVAPLADGAIAVSGRYTIAAGTFRGATISVAKDTAAPAAPTASVAAGAYPSGQSVSLAGEGGATVRYTTDGSDPTTAGRVASGPLSVASSQTLKAIAVDAAGNASPVAAFGYVIVRAPAATPASLAAGLRVEAMRVIRRLGLSTARRHGIAVLVTAPRGAKVVRVRLLRNRHVVAQVVRQVKGTRLLTVVLPRTPKGRRHLRRGAYLVQVTPGLDRGALGVTTSRGVRLR